MGWRSWIGLCCLGLVAAACGALPGTSSGSDDAAVDTPTASPQPLVTPTPVAAPTPLPTATARPTATPLPTPSPTPGVIDSYTTMLSSVRALFDSSSLQDDIAELVPLPFAIPIPDDARLQRVDLGYGRWDLWEQITDQFPPIDTAADVVVSAGFLTDQDVDSLRERFAVAPLEEGYVVTSDDSRPGAFSDVVYEFNGGVLSRGRDGEYRVSIFRQGDETFVELRVRAELDNDTDPPLASWPDLFTIPFSGDFTGLAIVAIKSADGIEVVSDAQWILGARGSSQEAAMQTLAAEYPTSAITIKDTISTGTNAAAVATISHSTGSSGAITLDFTQEYTTIDIRLLSLPG